MHLKMHLKKNYEVGQPKMNIVKLYQRKLYQRKLYFGKIWQPEIRGDGRHATGYITQLIPMNICEA